MKLTFISSILDIILEDLVVRKLFLNDIILTHFKKKEKTMNQNFNICSDKIVDTSDNIGFLPYQISFINQSMHSLYVDISGL